VRGWMMVVLVSLGCSTASSSPEESGFPDAGPPIDARPRIDGSSTIDAAPEAVTLEVRATIDGTSRLILGGNVAQWEHMLHVAPGRLNGSTMPTQLIGVDWFPAWPDQPTAENRDCECVSTTFTQMSPPIPRSPMEITITRVQTRDTVQIIQSPGPLNGYTTIIEFDDDALGDAEYIISIEFDPMD
jgi:hypothetical protein